MAGLAEGVKAASGRPIRGSSRQPPALTPAPASEPASVWVTEEGRAGPSGPDGQDESTVAPAADSVGCVAVAFSGGRDSTALLHCTLRQAAVLGLRVLAIHIHHGLLPEADAWLRHCRAQCRRWARQHAGLQFVSQRLAGQPAAGDSVEAWARQARYRALRQLARQHGASLLLLAHHQRDQAETLLLQALRGGGLAGLAGMPRQEARQGLVWARPWLAQPRGHIDAYVQRHRLTHIEDPSNQDPRFARNRLRLAVWPSLQQAFPQADSSLADAASWAQQALDCLDELAAMDLARLDAGNGLELPGWQTLSPARRSLVLRHWLQRCSGQAAPASLVQRLLEELPTSRSGAGWPCPVGSLWRQRQRLVWRADPVPAIGHGVARPSKASTPPSPAPPPETRLCVTAAGRINLPGWGGSLWVQPVAEGGVPLAWLAHAELRARAGGEQFQAGMDRPPRSLKKQFQAAGLPAWARSGPLVFSGGQLVYVPGLGLDSRVIGLPGQALVQLAWEPADRLPEPG